MKKLVAFAAVIAAVSFTSCGNKSAESTEVAETETTTVEEVAPATEEVAPAAEGDSTAVAAPAEETPAAPAE